MTGDMNAGGFAGKPIDVPPPPLPILPELRTNGQMFEQEDSAPFTVIETSDFNLLARYLAEEDILPILAQRRDAGFNTLRVWTLFDIPKIGTLLVCDYARIPAFVRLCAAYGFYVEFTAYTGINDPEHWRRLCEAGRSSTPRSLMELVNELDQNTNEPDTDGRVFDLALYSKPEGLLSSHGSNGSQARPVEDFWDYATFHTNGAPEEVRKVGHNAMEIWDGATLTGETSRCPEAYDSEQFAFDASAGAALLCAGSCFHSVHGKTSELWDEAELRCAKAWTAGARSVDVTQQHQPYQHRADLEGTEYLRVYQRGSCLVRIRP